ncbi:hypothetical protein AB1Y20_009692 [Prymnesium parvum]|uniref:Prohibitin n=1 Tax=Prymnesium parvum TaxID=97485 RepID=A0AB34K4X3_PRYPA
MMSHHVVKASRELTASQESREAEVSSRYQQELRMVAQWMRDAEFANLDIKGFEGLPVQHFDPKRDEETPAERANKELLAVKTKNVAKMVGRNLALGAVTGAPGIIFGVAGIVGAKAEKKLHERMAKSSSAMLKITQVRFGDLYVINKGPLGHRKMSPFVRAKLVNLPGASGYKYSCQLPAMSNVGPDVVFPPDKYFSTMAMPITDVQLARNACLLIMVEDLPEFAIVKFSGLRDFNIGQGILALGQLVDALNEFETIAAEVNVALRRGQGFQEYAGMVRLKVELKLS